MAKYLFIPVVGEIKVLELDEPVNFSEVYELIGCDFIETVRVVFSDIIMMVDESGKIKSPAKSLNPRASMFYGGFRYGDYIAGDVLIGKEILTADGFDIGGIPPMFIEYLLKLFRGG